MTSYAIYLHMADVKEQRVKKPIVQLLLKHGADANAEAVNAEDNGYSTPLHLATSSDPEIVQLLLQHGADINALDQRHRTPLHLAMQSQVSDKLRDLLAHG